MTQDRNDSPGESIAPISYRGIVYELNCFIAYYTLLVGWIGYGGYGYSIVREPWRAWVALCAVALGLVAIGVKVGLSPRRVKSRMKFHCGHGLILSGTLVAGLWMWLTFGTGEAGVGLGWSFVVLFPLTFLLWVGGAVLLQTSRA